MSEDEKLVIKWLESDEGEEWSKNNHSQLLRPLVSLIPDGQPSCVLASWVTWSW